MVYIGILGAMLSCTHAGVKPSEPEKDEVEYFTTQESIQINRQWLQDESFRIDRFIERHGWDAISTGTGVRYQIYETGNGDQVEAGKLVTLDFEVRLIDADTTLCYSSKETGPQTFLVEMDNVESGLHEAVTYLKVGDKARVILPHVLAHGLAGNLDKIPPLSAVLYDLTVLGVSDPE